MIKLLWDDRMNIFLLEDDEAIGIGLTYSLKNDSIVETLKEEIN